MSMLISHFGHDFVMVLVLMRRTDMVSVFRVGFGVLYVVNVGVRHGVGHF